MLTPAFLLRLAIAALVGNGASASTVKHRFAPTVTPDDPIVTAAIDEELAAGA